MKTIHFLATVLTALALIPGGAHLMELPNKFGLGQEAYFTVQAIVGGLALAGAVIVAAILMNLVVAIARWRNRRAFRLSILAFLLLGATLGIFFGFTEPQNKATLYWTSVPAEWERVRDEVNALPSVKAAHRNMQMKLVGAAAVVEPDSAARILLPSSQRGTTGIEKRAVLLGMGNKFELWSEQAHLAKIRQTIGEDDITSDMAELRL